MFVYEVQCEWDIGQEYQKFSSKETAEHWVNNNLNLKEMYINETGQGFEGPETFEDYIDNLFDEGYLDIIGFPIV